MFFEMTAILDAIIDFWESPMGIFGGFSILFHSYSRNYPENCSLLWAKHTTNVLWKWRPFWTPSWIS